MNIALPQSGGLGAGKGRVGTREREETLQDGREEMGQCQYGRGDIMEEGR